MLLWARIGLRVKVRNRVREETHFLTKKHKNLPLIDYIQTRSTFCHSSISTNDFSKLSLFNDFSIDATLHHLPEDNDLLLCNISFDG